MGDRRFARIRRIGCPVLWRCLPLVLLAGCGGHAQPAVALRAQPAVVVRVSPRTSLADQPLTIRVTGLQPGRRATLALASTDASGDRWRSSATYRANTRGSISLGRGAAVGGSYTGVNPMGLIETLAPAAHGDELYLWDGAAPQQFTVQVEVKGSTRARGEFWRALAASGVSYETESLADVGFFGQYWLPARSSRRHSAVLEFGGSEGGLDGQLVGAALASHGYPTLDIAYFKEPGLPSRLSRIPLEYFARALDWLRRQSQVDP